MIRCIDKALGDQFDRATVSWLATFFNREDNQIAALDGPDSVGLWRVLPSTLRVQETSCFPLPKFGAKVLARLLSMRSAASSGLS